MQESKASFKENANGVKQKDTFNGDIQNMENWKSISEFGVCR